MILTGIAKEDFKRWVYKEYDYQDLEVIYPKYLVDTLIIEWLDSVGLFCVPNYNFINTNWSYSVKNIDTILLRGCSYISRQEATKQAILKANEIYNESNTKKD